MFFEPLEGRMMLSTAVRLAAIGDFGAHSTAEHAVAKLVASWGPDFVITTGDNNYPSGSAQTIDRNIGADYHSFIYPYVGKYGAGAADRVNRFFPTLGNHDLLTGGGKPYLSYFALPGNERYYTYRSGPVQIFAIDSNPEDPDLYFTSAKKPTWNSPEAKWLKKQLAKSTATWKIVYFHHPPYSSGTVHGSSVWMRWPFRQWGATAVLSGHEHNYERLSEGGLPYFVDGSGGDSLYRLGPAIKGSQKRFSADHGGMLITADEAAITFSFVTVKGRVVDRYTIRSGAKPVA